MFSFYKHFANHNILLLTQMNKETYMKKIMLAVTNQKGGVFFLHGYGGTGKT